LILYESNIDAETHHQEEHAQINELNATNTLHSFHDNFLKVCWSTEELRKETDDQLDSNVDTTDDSSYK